MKFFISCGEVSGDIHAGNLVRELKNFFPDAEWFGIGGENLKSQGVELILHINEMGVIGFAEALKNLPKAVKHFRISKEASKKADVCIFVDYPGFNLKLAKETKKMGKKNIYYILPQTWAWGEWRVKELKSNFDLLLSIIPFEEDYFKKHGVEVHFVGSPVYDRFLERKDSAEEIRIPDKKIIGILPGSRKQEVEKLLPHIEKIIDIVNEKRKDIHFIVSQKVPFQLKNLSNVNLFTGDPYSIIKSSDAVLVTSGTATLETAFFEKPMVVMYKTSFFTYFLGKIIAKIKHISLVNLILGEEVVPEFIQNINEKKIAKILIAYLENQELCSKVQEKLRKLNIILKPGAAKNAALKIHEEVSKWK